MRGDSLTLPRATVSNIATNKVVHSRTGQVEFVFDLKVVFEDGTSKDLSGKQVAIMTKRPVRLPVGSRVVAISKVPFSDDNCQWIYRSSTRYCLKGNP